MSTQPKSFDRKIMTNRKASIALEVTAMIRRSTVQTAGAVGAAHRCHARPEGGDPECPERAVLRLKVGAVTKKNCRRPIECIMINRLVSSNLFPSAITLILISLLPTNSAWGQTINDPEPNPVPPKPMHPPGPDYPCPQTRGQSSGTSALPRLATLEHA